MRIIVMEERTYSPFSRHCARGCVVSVHSAAAGGSTVVRFVLRLVLRHVCCVMGVSRHQAKKQLTWWSRNMANAKMHMLFVVCVRRFRSSQRSLATLVITFGVQIMWQCGARNYACELKLSAFVNTQTVLGILRFALSVEERFGCTGHIHAVAGCVAVWWYGIDARADVAWLYRESVSTSQSHVSHYCCIIFAYTCTNRNRNRKHGRDSLGYLSLHDVFNREHGYYLHSGHPHRRLRHWRNVSINGFGVYASVINDWENVFVTFTIELKCLHNYTAERCAVEWRMQKA